MQSYYIYLFMLDIVTLYIHVVGFTMISILSSLANVYNVYWNAQYLFSLSTY